MSFFSPAFAHLCANMGLLHSSEQHCVNVAMYLLIPFVLPFMYVYDPVFGLSVALGEWGFPFCPKRRVNLFVYFSCESKTFIKTFPFGSVCAIHSSEKLDKITKGKRTMLHLACPGNMQADFSQNEEVIGADTFHFQWNGVSWFCAGSP